MADSRHSKYGELGKGARVAGFAPSATKLVMVLDGFINLFLRTADGADG